MEAVESAKRFFDPVGQMKAFFHEGKVGRIFFQKTIVLYGLFPDEKSIAGSRIAGFIFPAGNAVDVGSIFMLRGRPGQADPEAALWRGKKNSTNRPTFLYFHGVVE